MIFESKVNILIVDDDVIKAESIKRYIDICGENIFIYDNGRDALRFLLSNHCAVILLDVNMPEMDGFETASLIRKRKENEFTPIIFITSYSSDAAQVTKGYSLGAVDYLFTPIVPQILLAKVKVLIDLFKMNYLLKKNSELLSAANTDIKILNDSLQKRARILERQALLLEEANKELESFSFSVSHDLRAPLRHIVGYADLLSDNSFEKLNDKEKGYLNSIVDISKKMESLIDQLLNFSRLGRASLQPVKIDLAGLVLSIIDEINLESNNHKIIWNIGEFPEITADYNYLKIALVNYLHNAVKFSKHRQPPEISVACIAAENEFIFSIKDNGVGFNMEYYSRLFGVFQRLHTQDEFEGIGIGLANTKKIITLHGGKVWAESEPDKGAAFYFSLPFHDF